MWLVQICYMDVVQGSLSRHVYPAVLFALDAVVSVLQHCLGGNHT